MSPTGGECPPRSAVANKEGARGRASIRAVLLPAVDSGRELGGGLVSRGLLPCGLALALRVNPAAPELRVPPALALRSRVSFEDRVLELTTRRAR